MAIVFISPKKKQRVFFWALGVLLVLVVVVIFFITFLPEFGKRFNIPIPIPEGTFTVPDVKINFNIVDSDQVKNLESFEEIKTEFTYIAEDKDGNQTTGAISAFTANEAKTLLEQKGLKVSSLVQVNAGRDNPFISYYQSSTNTSVKKTK